MAYWNYFSVTHHLFRPKLRSEPVQSLSITTSSRNSPMLAILLHTDLEDPHFFVPSLLSLFDFFWNRYPSLFPGIEKLRAQKKIKSPNCFVVFFEFFFRQRSNWKNVLLKLTHSSFSPWRKCFTANVSPLQGGSQLQLANNRWHLVTLSIGKLVLCSCNYTFILFLQLKLRRYLPVKFLMYGFFGGVAQNEPGNIIISQEAGCHVPD